ncbi:molybdenum cofactor guanylyltransferase MobA [Falsirhodobacter deserti]|uniref:molybdenum cofactor guanylyltransferase MobA n=1 Tax=Falsirhodobacter deserti TaxID=1365611 RepID=UPI000FE3DFD0|nr:molybdenum cofactor guanylyltransferase MobA [Falsirhodobacter deserti]
MICGVILAGGRGQRMGGADKALLPLGQRPLLDHVVERLAPQVDTLVLSANGDPARFQGRLPVVQDETPDYPGPLAGILAGMIRAEGAGATRIVTVATDTPFFPDDLVKRLCDVDGAAVRIATSAGRPHPTFGLWPVEAAPLLRDCLHSGDRSIMHAARLAGAAMVEFASAPTDPFFNINTAEDYRKCMA